MGSRETMVSQGQTGLRAIWERWVIYNLGTQGSLGYLERLDWRGSTARQVMLETRSQEMQG